MQLLSKVTIKRVVAALFLLFLGVFTLLTVSNPAKAALTPAQEAELRQSIKDCPDAVKRNLTEILDSGSVEYVNGTYVTSSDGTNPTSFRTCTTASQIEKIFIRVFVIAITLVGAVFAFSLGKSAILMIVAFDNQEAFQEAVGSLRTSIFAVIGVFFSYLGIVFLLTGVFGLGRSTNSEWNLVCGQRLVFQITFGDSKNPVDPCAA